MKILHVIPTLDPAYGGPVAGLLAQDAATRGVGSREAVTLDAPGAPHLNDCPIPVHAVGLSATLRARLSLVGRYGFTPHLIPWLRANVGNYNAVVVNGLWNFATFAASRVLPSSSTKYYVFTHGMLDPWFARTYPIKHIGKTISWVTNEGVLLRSAAGVLFTTEEERELARNQFPLQRYKEFVVGYGTSAPPAASGLQTRAFKTLVPNLADNPFLLFLSRLHPKKGCDLLIEAFANVNNRRPTHHLVLAGPGEASYVRALKAQAEALGLSSRVHFPGMLVDDAKWGAFRNADAFVLPSHQENFGIVVAEALACGVPVLTTNKVNIWREIEQRGGGLIAEDTVEGVTALLKAFGELTPAERAQMGADGKVTFAKCFDMSKVAHDLMDLIAR